jgi:type II secretory ATPase GspE/PulE/Tfp pilus assembly ATPase PilB-like protein
VQPRIDVTFATTLPFILRQDPDVILVGEIRDVDTAEMAFRASLTGHLVLSTLHTNDAPSAAMRLVDMGVEPYLIASSIIGIIAQRLVRRICPRCREGVEPSDVELDRLELSPEQAKKIKFHRGRGCAQCRNTGYQGRIGVYELMTMSSELRDAITARANAADLRRIAIRNVRRHSKDRVEEEDVSEDDVRRAEKTLQIKTDEHIARLDEILAAKEEELLEV